MNDVVRLAGPHWCRAVMTGPWNASAGRHFIAYRARHGFRWLLGQGVVDEFATLGSPLLFAARERLGRIYDAGITLAHRRDSEMAIDLGWPPLCVGLPWPAGPLPDDWQQQLLATLAAGTLEPGPAEREPTLRSDGRDGERISVLAFPAEERAAAVALIATDAPLLPHQLGRLCDLDDRGLTLALATGNRVTRQANAAAQPIDVVSEARLARLAATTEALL